jgi:hypothetical protein
MKRYDISNLRSSKYLGEFAGDTPQEAVDAMARDAGYKDLRDMASITDPEDLDKETDRLRAELVVTTTD